MERGFAMRPRERRETSEQDLFRSRLDQIIDMNHALVKLARTIDWRFLEAKFGTVYTDKPGQPPLPTRLMAGLAREAQGAAAGELGGGDPDGRDEALRPRLCCDRYDGAAEGGDVPDRRQAAQPGARAAGATDEEARSEPAPIVCAGRQVGSDQTPALRPCSSIQARQPELTQAQDLSRPCHPRHRAASHRE